MFFFFLDYGDQNSVSSVKYKFNLVLIFNNAATGSTVIEARTIKY